MPPSIERGADSVRRRVAAPAPEGPAQWNERCLARTLTVERDRPADDQVGEDQRSIPSPTTVNGTVAGEGSAPNR